MKSFSDNPGDDLHQLLSEYSEIVESTNSIIAKCDRDGNLTFLNTYGLGFFGFEQGDIIGKPLVGTIDSSEDNGTTATIRLPKA